MKGSLSPQWLKTIREVHLDLQDNTEGDVSTSAHGFVPKALGSTARFLREDGTWAIPPSGPGSGAANSIYPAFTTPVNGDFTWENDDGVATVTVNANGGIYLVAPASATQNIRMRKKSAPGTPYTITAAFLFNHVNLDITYSGLFWRQSSDGKIIGFFCSRGSTGTTDGLFCQDFNNETAAGVTNKSVGYKPYGVSYLQFGETSTDRFMRFGTDGYNFIDFFSESRTTFLTADEIGFFCSSNTASWPAVCTLLSWAQT